jgi:hypothetical protein
MSGSMAGTPIRMAGGRQAVCGLLLGLSWMAASCGGSPIDPTPTPPPPPPAPASNAAPSIRSVTVSTTRAEVERDVGVTAVVEDTETNPDALTYVWTATVGTIQGTGRTVTWRLPRGAAETPSNVTLTLVVTEPYQVLENNVIVTRQHRVERTSDPFRVHDSTGEISRMTLRFLIELFGNSSVGPDACVGDFSDTCSGKAAEYRDIVINRAERRITSVEATVQSVSFNGAMTFADVIGPCTFRDIDLKTGRPFASTGRCELTAVYHTDRWWLCESYYREPVAIQGVAPARRRPISAYWKSEGR